MAVSKLDDFVEQQLVFESKLCTCCFTFRSLLDHWHAPRIFHTMKQPSSWKNGGRITSDDQVHAYYCVLAKDHEDAFITVIKHSSEIDAWISENVKELGWKRIYGLSSCRLEDASALVTFNRDFPMYRIYFLY